MFWKKKKKKSKAPASPEELWDALMDSVQRDDGPRFTKLCTEHQDAIADAFPKWQKPEPSILKDPARAQAYINVLGYVAEHFAESFGRPELWEALTGGADNPFTRWDAKREEIGGRIKANDFAGAIELARALLDDVSTHTGDAADETADQVLGQLGQLLLHSGQIDEARPVLEDTLERCQARGQQEAVRIYLSALHDADRYAGRVSRWRDRLASHLESSDPHTASWLRRVGERYPDGEPLLRMVTLAPDGRRAELDEEMPATNVQVIFERSRPTLGLAERWITRGRQHTEAGDIDNAIASYTAAAEADPCDPHCRYQIAYLSMISDRPQEAIGLYEEIERLAPGWFHSRTWRSLAERQLSGSISHEVVKLVDLLQDGGLNAKERLDATRQPILDHPRVPELFFFRGEALSELGREDDARSAWLAGIEVSADIPSTRSRLLFALGMLEETLAVESPNLMAWAAATLQRNLTTN